MQASSGLIRFNTSLIMTQGSNVIQNYLISFAYQLTCYNQNQTIWGSGRIEYQYNIFVKVMQGNMACFHLFSFHEIPCKTTQNTMGDNSRGFPAEFGKHPQNIVGCVNFQHGCSNDRVAERSMKLLALLSHSNKSCL